MAGRGPLPKERDRRQRRNPDGAQVLELINRDELPAPREHWSAEVVEAWRAAWSSPQSTGWSDEMLFDLYGLFDMRQQILDLDAVWTENMLVVGSRGQERPHPAFKMANDLRREARAVAALYGIDLRNKVSLGIRGADAVSRSLTARATEARRVANVDDPRLAT